MLLQNTQKEYARKTTVYHSIDGYFAIRKGKWKLLFCSGSGGWSSPSPKEAKELNLPPLQLYDMEKDASEKNNLSDKFPDVVKELTLLMHKYIEEGRSTPGTKQQNVGKVILEK